MNNAVADSIIISEHPGSNGKHNAFAWKEATWLTLFDLLLALALLFLLAGSLSA